MAQDFTTRGMREDGYKTERPLTLTELLRVKNFMSEMTKLSQKYGVSVDGQAARTAVLYFTDDPYGHYEGGISANGEKTELNWVFGNKKPQYAQSMQRKTDQA